MSDNFWDADEVEKLLAAQEYEREQKAEQTHKDIRSFLNGVRDLVRAYGKFYPESEYGSLYHDYVNDWSKDFDL